MTLGEISVVIEGYAERERRETVSRVSSALRALGAAFGKNSNPYEGLLDAKPSRPVSPAEVRLMRFWRSPNA